MPEKAASRTAAHMRHRLAWVDQVAFELFKATGRAQLMQCIWLYDREVNLTALDEMNERLAALSFNRLIAPSPLRLGRPRWVKPIGAHQTRRPDPQLLPRSGLMQWANRQARQTIDPVTGPAWRLDIQRFDDGTTAVSILGSHLVIDGIGALRAIEAAVTRTGVANPYLPQGARGVLAGCVSDMLQILSDTPRTVAAIAAIARKIPVRSLVRRKGPQMPPVAAPDDPATVVELPSVAVTINSQAWDACARRLGGRPNTLFPGFVATLAMHLGRRRASDGAVSLLVPIDRRHGLADERALAIDFRTITVAPERLCTDLRPLNTLHMAMLRSARNNDDATQTSLLPAVAWMPRGITTAMVNNVFAYAEDLPVSCSNLGTLADGLARIDGAPCARLLTRAVDVNVTRRDLQRSHGHLVVVASRYANAVSLCIEACQLEPALTTPDVLRQATARTMADFALDGVIDC